MRISQHINIILHILLVMLLHIRSATITSKGQISIPKDLRENKQFTEGSKIVLLAYDDHIELRPIESIQEHMQTAFASEKSLSDWNNEEEQQAWKDL